jgi:predicted phosphodiesterase
MERKKFLWSSISLIGGTSLFGFLNLKDKFQPIRFGIVSDIHYANKQPNIGRYYKQSLDKLSECIKVMNNEKVDFLIELGDFVDKGDTGNETLKFLDTVEKKFSQFKGPRYHVLGNHEEANISKQEFLERITNGHFSKAKNYYAFEKNGFQFIVLDANYNPNGTPYNKGNFDWRKCHVPQEQLEWLKGKIQQNRTMPTIAFLHQRLDRFYSLKNYCPDNSGKVRKILEETGNVLAVFQAHDHQGGFNKINNIYYYTSKAMITGSGPKNSSYGIVEIRSDFEKRWTIEIKGYRKEKSLILG